MKVDLNIDCEEADMGFLVALPEINSSAEKILEDENGKWDLNLIESDNDSWLAAKVWKFILEKKQKQENYDPTYILEYIRWDADGNQIKILDYYTSTCLLTEDSYL
jgi:hypothetical protein